jgi:DNA-directed RNA polymerase specialized sigma subunit
MTHESDINALDEFLLLIKEGAAPPAVTVPEVPKVELKATQKKEIDLWQQWNTGGRKPHHLKPLYESFKPVLEKETRTWANKVELPTSAIRAEVDKHFVNAIKTYDPKRGAQLGSWVHTNLQKTGRFIRNYQNVGRISEQQISRINEFKRAKQDLFDKLGYEPDTSSLADHLKWSSRRVSQMQKELSRKDLPTSGFMHDPAELLNPKELEAIRILQFDTRMSPEERAVYEYTFGINGKPMLKPGEISKKTNIHQSKISRIRNKLKGYVKEALEVL